MPPATSQNKPSDDRLLINGLIAKIMIQPINTYIRVDKTLYLPVKNNFKATPEIAMPQDTPKIVQPTQPLSVISVNGV